MVNQFMASVAANYCYQLLVRHTLTTFRTVIHLPTLSMLTDPITVATVAQAAQVSEALLTAQGETHGTR